MNYTFSPIGEFWLIKHANFSLQVRTIQAWNVSQMPVPGGSVFGGVVSSVPMSPIVCVLMNADRTQLNLVVDYDTGMLKWYQEASDGDAMIIKTVTVSKSSGRLNVNYKSGVGFGVKIQSGQLIITLVVTPALRNSGMLGLFGNFNGNPSDDLTSRSGQALPPTSSEKEIYYDFGLSFIDIFCQLNAPFKGRVTANETLFWYDTTESYISMQSDSWVPYFATGSLPNNATDVCGSSDQCYRDLYITGNVGLASGTVTALKTALATAFSLSNNVPSITGPNSVNVIVGSSASFNLTISDPDRGDSLLLFTRFQPSTIPGASLNGSLVTNMYTFYWIPQSRSRVLLQFSGNDSRGAVAPSFQVQVLLCDCNGRGTCQWNVPQSGFTSIDSFVIVNCLCNYGYQGSFCESPIDWCSLGVCGNRNCTNNSTLSQGYSCGACSTGYELSGTKCRDINECSTGVANCTQPQQQCVNTVGSFRCVCSSGYYSSLAGINCTDIDECQLMTAQCGQFCTNLPGSYQCSCAENYSLQSDSKTCKPVGGSSPCSSINSSTTASNNNTEPCANGFCAAINRTTQCLCPPGFILNGTACVDIDECAMRTAMCDTGAICNNTLGSYSCICPAGSKLAVNKRSCSGCIDGYFGHECQSVCLCAMGTTCNTVTGCPKCMALGLTGGNCQTDVDECNVTANICGANSACRNLVGSYSCICDDWYVRGTNSCQVLNACKYNRTRSNPYPPNPSLCSYPQGTCFTNGIPGIFYCNCTNGYTGSACQTAINDCATKPCMNGGTCFDLGDHYFCNCPASFYGANCQFGNTLSTTPTIRPNSSSTSERVTSRTTIGVPLQQIQTMVIVATVVSVTTAVVLISVAVFVLLSSSPPPPAIAPPLTSSPFFVSQAPHHRFSTPWILAAPKSKLLFRGPEVLPIVRLNPAENIGHAVNHSRAISWFRPGALSEVTPRHAPWVPSFYTSTPGLVPPPRLKDGLQYALHGHGFLATRNAAHQLKYSDDAKLNRQMFHVGLRAAQFQSTRPFSPFSTSW